MNTPPNKLGNVAVLTKEQRKAQIEPRRQWLAQTIHEYKGREDETPPSLLESMVRVNRELGELVGVGVSDDFAATLTKMGEPATKHPGFPGATSYSSTHSPSHLKAGHWSQPILKAVENKALTSGSVVVPALTQGIVPIVDRPALLTQVIPTQTLTGTGSYAYLKETVRTHAAAEVAAGATKPVSTYTVSKVEDTVRTIATISQPVSRFDLEDAGLLDQYIQGSLSRAVLLRLDSQILNGDGSAPNLRGILNVAGIQVQAYSTSILTTARKALSLLYAIEVQNGVYVMSPAQWEAIELLQLSSGGYLMQGNQSGGPVDLATRRLWGQPVIVTSALSGNNAVLFAPAYTQLWERDTVQVDWSEAPIGSQAGVPGFSTNEITFRAEGRYGFGVTRPTAVVQWATQ